MTTNDDLHTVTSVTRIADGLYTATIADGWQQGRGAFGGLVLGILARALEEAEPDRTRTVRTISGEIVGPVLPGEAAIEVEVLRRGSGASTLSAKLRQGGEVQAHATAVIAKPRADTRAWTRIEAPSPPPFASVPRPPERGGAVFARHFDIRPTGALPFSGGAEPIATGWVRAERPLSRLGTSEIIAYADTWYPALFTVETGPRPMATIAFTLQVCADLTTLDPAAPMFHRAIAVTAREGYSVELRELWTESGQLVALNQQTFVVIK